MQRSIFKILVVFCTLCSADVLAQRTVVQESPDTSGEIPLYGKNRAMYVHQLVKIGMFAPVYDEGMFLNPWATSLSYELRTKAKICSWNALVLDVGYRCDRFPIKEDTAHMIPFYGSNHKRARVSCHNITFSLCDRINFGRRGNILGIYLDLGFYGDYLFRSSHLVVDEHYDSNAQGAQHYVNKLRMTRLSYINQLNYGLTARFGWEWGSVYGMYRMTDLILDPDALTSWPDMPKLVVGVEMYFVD
jgi:hypothetical protein